MRLSKDESQAMLQGRRRSQGEYYQMFKRKLKNRVCFYFCIGFILSAILAISAYFLSYGILEWYPDPEDQNLVTSTSPTVTDTSPTVTDTSPTVTDTTTAPSQCQKRIIGFDYIMAEREITKSQVERLTHLILLNLNVGANGTLEFKSDREKKKFMKYVETFKNINGLKIMFTLSDIDGDSKAFSNAITNPETRKILLNSIASFILEHRVDGIDVHWRLEKEFQRFSHLPLFCKELKDRLKKLAVQMKRKEDFVISVFFPVKKVTWDLGNILDFVDFITIDTSGYHRWQQAGPFSPLYSKSGKSTENNVDYSMKNFTCTTGQPNKLNVLVEFIGQLWRNVTEPETPSEFNSLFWMPWRTISKQYNLAEAHWDDVSKSSFFWNPWKREYLSFECGTSLQEKIMYAIDKNIGGIAVWKMENDDDQNTMLETLKSAELCSGNDNTALKYDCS